MMQIFDVTSVPPRSDEPLVLAIGKFDGVHIGHQAILREARQHLGAADALGVMSIWPHPAWVFAHKPGYERSLTPHWEKVRFLQSLGVGYLYNVHFTKQYALTSAESFVRDHLGNLPLKRVVVGFDFRFGKGGVADAYELQRLCGEIGVPVSIVSPVEENGLKVSSSQIRDHLENGRVEAVDALLGRPYAVVGEVVTGAHLGRQIGFPTANLGGVEEYVLPATGVYAVSVELLEENLAGSGNWFGVMNAGYRPTVDGETFKMEVHLLGYTGNLYGKKIRVSLLHRVRDEQKFSGVDALTAQIHQDIQHVKNLLGLSSSRPD